MRRFVFRPLRVLVFMVSNALFLRAFAPLSSNVHRVSVSVVLIAWVLKVRHLVQRAAWSGVVLLGIAGVRDEAVFLHRALVVLVVDHEALVAVEDLFGYVWLVFCEQRRREGEKER